MASALIALHYQNDICHAEGRIPFAIDRAQANAERFLEASREALERARGRGWTIAHVHIAFAPDYADLPRNCRLFRTVEALGAVKLGSWGAAALEGFELRAGEVHLMHRANSAFFETGLQAMLDGRAVREVTVCGLATQFSVEHTVRDAADRGYRVTVLRDCCASADPVAAAAALDVMAMLADVRALPGWP